MKEYKLSQLLEIKMGKIIKNFQMGIILYLEVGELCAMSTSTYMTNPVFCYPEKVR